MIDLDEPKSALCDLVSPFPTIALCDHFAIEHFVLTLKAKRSMSTTPPSQPYDVNFCYPVRELENERVKLTPFIVCRERIELL